VAVREPDADYDELDEVLSLSGQGYYLQIRISPEELGSLSAVGAASWEDRTSIKAGEALGNPVFWYRSTEDPTAVVVLVGADDEAWGLSLEVPAAVLLRELRGHDGA
jgi:hypothetical protein